MSITDDDRALIQRLVIVEYVLASQKELEVELFQLRRQMMELKIKRVFVRKGEYRFEVRGSIIEGKMDEEMMRIKAEAILEELRK